MKLPRLYGGRGTRLRLARTANSHNYNLLASNQVRVSRPEQGSKERNEGNGDLPTGTCSCTCSGCKTGSDSITALAKCQTRQSSQSRQRR